MSNFTEYARFWLLAGVVAASGCGGRVSAGGDRVEEWADCVRNGDIGVLQAAAFAKFLDEKYKGVSVRQVKLLETAVEWGRALHIAQYPGFIESKNPIVPDSELHYGNRVQVELSNGEVSCFFIPHQNVDNPGAGGNFIECKEPECNELHDGDMRKLHAAAAAQNRR